ncbi:MAG: Inner membrane protein translocase component YidC, long form [Candidatus Ozemobacter sibiricus]|uniref:Membrane protein insertase YidC n=1 Tax=Candidatus Ozemobacter sibiricus TaxID=2268124 RepID=A0A367ZR55_9BACT|nr:MAG: Inner membrane protein translocase component YidC, long form [Candidatus Ozemobacter sibiricus]
MSSHSLNCAPASIRRSAFSRRGRLACGLVALLAACFLLVRPGPGQTQPAERPPVSSVAARPLTAETADLDGDNLPDVRIETPRLRVVLAGKTGSIAVYYLKGVNFEENLYPPVLQDMGYSFASDTLTPFECTIGSEAFRHFGFHLKIEERTPEKIVVAATANVPLQSGVPQLGLIRRFTFSTTGYTFDLEQAVTNLGDEAMAVGDEAQGGVGVRFGPGLFLEPITNSFLLALKPDQVESFDKASAFMKAASAGGYTGVGLKSNYFCLLIDAKSPSRIAAQDFELHPSDPNKRGRTYRGEVVRVSGPPLLLKARETRASTMHIYFGPKLLDELRAIQREQVTDYGFLSTVLLRILQFFNHLYPNFGLSIVLLTVVVRILLYPLTLKQTKSMAKVQKIQPLVQDLKDRYRDNPQKFNEEVLKLYQKHDVNPLGGCLPLLLQLPILFALYNTINISVELRKTPFLWMNDLSKADPLLLLPIGIAALMYYQQGQMQDPQQQQMMAFMPMFMFVITWSLPAGLLVYWFTSSVLGVFQQLQANRIMAAMKEDKT